MSRRLTILPPVRLSFDWIQLVAPVGAVQGFLLTSVLWGIVRPYLGVGGDGVFARETSGAVSLHNENMFVPHVFGGFDITLWHRVIIGAEHTGGALWSTQFQVGAVAF